MTSGPRLSQDLGHKNHMLLRNHGTLTVGRSVAAPSSACTIWSGLHHAGTDPHAGPTAYRSSRR